MMRALRRTNAIAEVLRCLAKAEKPLTKYEIWKETHLRQEGLYDAVKELKAARLIHVVEAARWRTGLTSEKYILDEKDGKIWAAIYNPGLEKKILGGKKAKLLKDDIRVNHRIFVNLLLTEFAEILLSEKGPPNYRTELIIQTDSKGTPITRWRVKGRKYSNRSSLVFKHLRKKIAGPGWPRVKDPYVMRP